MCTFGYEACTLVQSTWVTAERQKSYGGIFACLTTRPVLVHHGDSKDNRQTSKACVPVVRPCYQFCQGKWRDLWSCQATELVANWRPTLSRRETVALKLMIRASPHFGEAWDRLVQSVKKSLNVITEKQLATNKTLLTFPAEDESLLNSWRRQTLAATLRMKKPQH